MPKRTPEENRKDLQKVICSNCDKYFLKSNRKIKISKGQHFCSILCVKENQSKKTTLICCSWCKSEFKIKPSRHKKSKSGMVFCKNKCRIQAQSLNGLPEFTPSHYGKQKKEHLCNVCNKPTERLKYCEEHKQKFSYDEYIVAWKDNELNGNNADGTLRCHVRKYIFNKFESKCVKCGWNDINPITKKSVLQINHINGLFWDSSEKNLELLCPNCHSLTINFGILNKGNGRRLNNINNQ